jgi:hypothetical protein
MSQKCSIHYLFVILKEDCFRGIYNNTSDGALRPEKLVWSGAYVPMAGISFGYSMQIK